ncbi:MAG TPA: carboxypeptidase regulatory-like domain-containing protein [Longimicrobiales bacterium]|nr:carboxypeptidase regulatory-like domain-containing protein [Longimicrobiales bacterium]
MHTATRHPASIRHSGLHRLVRAIAVFACAAPVALPAQLVNGVLAEQLTLAPVPGASVTLYRVRPAGELEPVGMTATDELGAFSLEVPAPGVYRVQADLNGLSSPLSGVMDLTAEGSVGDVALLLPSVLLRSALSCSMEGDSSAAAIVGVVQDRDTEVPLPGTLVLATWREGRAVRRLEVEADAAGRYRMCLPYRAGEVTFQTYLFGRWEPHAAVAIDGPVLVIQDIDVAVPAAPRTSGDVIQERVLLEAASKTLGDLRGEILDRESEAPLRYAVVRLEGTPHQAISDEAGRFLFLGLQPASYTLQIRSIGYEVISEPVEVPAGKDVGLTLRVATQAVEIEGLVVTARTVAEELIRSSPFRRDVAYGALMALEEERGARAFETLRRSTPGLSITEQHREVGPPQLCIMTNRRVDTFQGPDRTFQLMSQLGNPCHNVQVVVDGVRIPDGPEFLLRTPASDIESIEFLPPIHAQILYGIGGDTANGVVVVYTRGKGPYVSPLRNR